MATTIEEALTAFVLSDAGFMAIVGTKFYPWMSPQGTTGKRTNYLLVSYRSDVNMNTGLPSGHAVARIQVDHWSDTTTAKADVLAMATAFRNAVGNGARKLEGFVGTMNGLTIKHARCEDERDLPELGVPGVEKYQGRRQQDWVFIFQES